MSFYGLRKIQLSRSVVCAALVCLAGVSRSGAASARGSYTDQWGRVVRTEAGERRNYSEAESTGLAAERGRGSGKLDAPPATAAVAGPFRVRQEWSWVPFGQGIGVSGFSFADFDGSGAKTLVAGGQGAGNRNRYWFTVETSGAELVTVSASPALAKDIDSLRVIDVDGDGRDEVLAGAGSQIHIYGLDAARRPQLLRTIATGATNIRGLAIVDVDADGGRELVFCDASNLYVLDLASGAEERRLAGLGGLDVAVGDVDADAALEIVVGNNVSTGYVVDGATGATEWANAGGFGSRVRIGDVDGDGEGEIVSSYWYAVRAYDGLAQSQIWSHATSHDVGALRLHDLDADGDAEVLYGDGQWGEIHLLDGATGTETGLVANPEHGVTDIALGDLDGDGALELLWGAGHTSSGPDYLYAAELATLTIERTSFDLGGPFTGLDIDPRIPGARHFVFSGFSQGEFATGYDRGFYLTPTSATHGAVRHDAPIEDSWNGIGRIRAEELDGDSSLEVVIACSEVYLGELVAIDFDSGAEQWRAPAEDGLSFRSHEIADIDNDGTLEVVAGSALVTSTASGIYLYVFDAATGALEWRSPALGAGPFNLLRIADLDGDAIPEIVAARDRAQVLVFDGATRALELTTPDYDVTALEAADTDGDGVAELFVGTSGGQLRRLDATTGAVAQTVYTSSWSINALVAADFNLDGVGDFALATATVLRIVDGQTGSVLWTSDYLGSTVGTDDGLAVGDDDNDGRLEIAVHLGYNGVQIWEASLDDAPDVYVYYPHDGMQLVVGTPLELFASAWDDEEGDLGAQIRWTSSLDGELGTGPQVSVELSLGTHVLTASVADSLGAPGESSLTITITTLPPVAYDQAIALAEDGSATVTLTGDDPEAAPLTYLIESEPEHGTLGGVAPELTYTPTTNYFGSDAFTFSVSDGESPSEPAMVTFTIDPVNDPPTANAQSTAAAEETPQAIVLTGSDIERSPLTFAIAVGPSHGSLSGAGSDLVYTATTNYNGPDSFSFTTDDGQATSEPATVSITVTPVNDPPTANAQSAGTFEDTPVSIVLTGGDVDGTQPTFTITAPPSHGTLSGTAPNLTFIPAANYGGADSFGFEASDGQATSLPAVVSITIVPVNDAPVAHAQAVATAEDTAVAITLIGSDVEGSALSYSIVSSPSRGALSGSAPNVTYTPTANLNGPDSLTFAVNDGEVSGASATVSISVAAVNDAPNAVADTATTRKNTAVTILVLANDSDPDGNSLTVVSTTPPTKGGTVAILSGGISVRFTPKANFTGVDTFAYTVSDGQGDTRSATVTVTVTK